MSEDLTEKGAKAPYGFSVSLDMGYDEARRATTEALRAEGFGVLTEIHVKDTLKKKLEVEFPRY